MMNSTLRLFFYPILFLFFYSCGSDEDKETQAPQEPEEEIIQEPEEEINEDAGGNFIPDGYTKIWEDHFDAATIDLKSWTLGTMKDPDTGDYIPGSDGDHLLKEKYSGYVTEEDSYLEDKALVLRNQKRSYQGTSPAGTYDYTSGWVMTMHKVHFNKGYVEMRAQFPSGDKVWPALWLVAEDLVWGPEWDMFEYFGKNTEGDDVMGMHLLFDEWPNEKWRTGFLQDYHKNYDCEAWHIYGFEWTDSDAIWSIDGLEVHRLNKLDDRVWAKWPDEEMYLIINNEVQTYAPDTNTKWPNYLKIDYVEIYQKDQN